ncbi:MAG: Lrp/AsnC family transcriptional regulator [Woeseia sp.]
MIDKTDYQILRELLADGRVSWVELAERVSLSPAATQRRVEALRAAGVIKGFSARIDSSALGHEVEAYVAVSVERHDIANAQRFREVILHYPEVQTCHMMSGEVDYLLRVVTTDLKAFGRFIEQKILSVPGVKDASSSIVLEPIKSESLNLPEPERHDANAAGVKRRPR